MTTKTLIFDPETPEDVVQAIKFANPNTIVERIGDHMKVTIQVSEPAPEYRKVTIPACDDHGGWQSVTGDLLWICPVCGGPRGEIREGHSFDGSARLNVSQWDNPCGHIDYYKNIRKELSRNYINDTHNAAIVAAATESNNPYNAKTQESATVKPEQPSSGVICQHCQKMIPIIDGGRNYFIFTSGSVTDWICPDCKQVTSVKNGSPSKRWAAAYPENSGGQNWYINFTGIEVKSIRNPETPRPSVATPVYEYAHLIGNDIRVELLNSLGKQGYKLVAAIPASTTEDAQVILMREGQS